MKQAADSTSANRAMLKRNGRFTRPKSMFDRLKEYDGRKSKLVKLKESRPELVEAVRRQMAKDARKNKRQDVILGVICILLFIGFLAWAWFL